MKHQDGPCTGTSSIKPALLGALAAFLFLAGCAARARWDEAALDDLQADVLALEVRVAVLESAFIVGPIYPNEPDPVGPLSPR